jgi:hypothetical protein
MPIKTSDVVTDTDVHSVVTSVRNDYNQIRRAFRDHDGTGLNSNAFEFPISDFDFDEEAVEIQPGEDYPRAVSDDSTVTAAYTKYGFEVAMADEAVEDSAIEFEMETVEDMAKAEERAVEQAAFNVLSANTNSGGAIDANSNDNGVIEYADVVAARSQLFADEYSISDAMILTDAVNGSDFLTMDEFTQASELGDSVVTSGLLPEGALESDGYLGNIIDLPVYITNTVDMGDGVAYVVDQSHFGWQSERMPMETTSYREESNDQTVYKVRGRWDWVATKPDANVQIDS